ncbi:hypothetical protein CNMCM6936_005878 [Aspergillus lentulus]|uniref:Uncharacterized protein n=1 Tax=Aspergillus lentulus TaxID=293939 RepID=A0AAN6BJH7_ASPLE|nr:hypothetical protein CNMCM6069_000778 [Aspergillus lentulus]KAF4157040.1 hypothetical protein CNMCM6936_005878 [Aspergillus lentulus]KAF4180660.1 hypothetical protein CNMCM7927_001078 [Aspergillus lentulus]KAF4192343.1 hypothetical protein CNMCM8694_000532 [Aspergillus lentulus]KAF4199311.1 hypothetical protein CNMCM8927_005405 [Aspergillus lentulus]
MTCTRTWSPTSPASRSSCASVSPSSREALEKFVTEVCSWEVDKSGPNGTVVKVPTNKENEARSEVKSERVGVDMFGRVIRRGFEQAA